MSKSVTVPDLNWGFKRFKSCVFYAYIDQDTITNILRVDLHSTLILTQKIYYQVFKYLLYNISQSLLLFVFKNIFIQLF
jgi:hypothetical protein